MTSYLGRRRAACAAAWTATILLAAAALPPQAMAHGTEAHLPDRLPLGDGKYSQAPQRGYLMSCQTRFNPNAPGAWATGGWVQDGYWYPTRKPVVPGQVAWPDWQLSVDLEGDRRLVRANNLPEHPSGIFPIPRDSEAFRYDPNINSIRRQDILLNLPAVPQVATQPSCVPMGMIGFTLSGVALFNAVDARGDDAPAYEIQDACNGHPQQSGQYHYHGYSACFEDEGGAAGGHSDLLGYALDGFGIYGLHGEDGRIMTNGDLDACHGHRHTVMWDGEMREIYHYHFTWEYPYSVGCFRGAVAPDLLQRQAPGGMPPPDGMRPRQGMGPRRAGLQGPGERGPGERGPGERGPGQGGPGQGGQEMLSRAATELGISADALRRALGPPPPDLAAAAQRLGISEDKLRAAMRRALAGR